MNYLISRQRGKLHQANYGSLIFRLPDCAEKSSKQRRQFLTNSIGSASRMMGRQCLVANV